MVNLKSQFSSSLSSSESLLISLIDAFFVFFSFFYFIAIWFVSSGAFLIMTNYANFMKVPKKRVDMITRARVDVCRILAFGNKSEFGIFITRPYAIAPRIMPP